MSKHIDFTQMQIVGIEGLLEVEYVDPEDRGTIACDSCGSLKSEYFITSNWDSMGMCTVGQCQSCMVEVYDDPTHPDTYNYIA